MPRSRTANYALPRCLKNTPESVKITELLAEVDHWTNMDDRFLNLRTQSPPKNRQALLTAVLADGINLGLTRMSEAWGSLCGLNPLQ
jgi:hypothetical protein